MSGVPDAVYKQRRLVCGIVKMRCVALTLPSRALGCTDTQPVVELHIRTAFSNSVYA